MAFALLGCVALLAGLAVANGWRWLPGTHGAGVPGTHSGGCGLGTGTGAVATGGVALGLATPTLVAATNTGAAVGTLAFVWVNPPACSQLASTLCGWLAMALVSHRLVTARWAAAVLRLCCAPSTV